MSERLRARAAEADRLHLALLALILLAGAGVRLAFLGEPMRYDEAFSFLRYAMQDADVIRRSYDLPNNHVLNTLGMHYAWEVAGPRAISVRITALAAGLLVPLAAYLAVRAIHGPAAGLWSAALTAGSGPLIEYSVNGRGYVPAALFLLVALWAGARILRGSLLWPVPVFVVSATLAMYAVPTAAFGWRRSGSTSAPPRCCAAARTGAPASRSPSAPP